MKTATKHTKHIDRVYTRARAYARRTSRDTFLAMVRAYGAFEDPIKELYAMMDIFEIQVLDAMIAAHLTGYLRSTAVAARHLAQQKMLGPFETAIRFTQRRLKVPQGQIDILKQRYGATAVAMTSQMGEAIERKTQKAIREIIEQNMHVKAGMKHLQGKLKKAINPWTLETVVRTQVQIAYGAGRWDANQASAIQEILWGYEYVIAGDFRVRPEHEMLEGVRLPKEHPRWNEIWPPNGFNCRCEALEIYMDDKQRARLKDVPGSKMVKGELVMPGPDPGWAINHGQIFTSDIAKTQNEIQAIVAKGVERGDVMFVTDRFGKTHEVIARWGKKELAPTPSNIAAWHKEFQVIEKKPTWMKTIDSVIAKGKTPNWKSPFWNPKRAEYFEIASKKAAGKKVIPVLKPVPKPVLKKPAIEIPKRIQGEMRLTGIKEEYREEVMQAYADMRTRFPVKAELSIEMSRGLAASPNAMASNMGTNEFATIHLHKKWFGKDSRYNLFKIAKKNNVKHPWAQPRTPGELIQHEYGHTYSRTISVSDQANTTRFWNHYSDRIRKEVSKYAAENPHEMFAEMFVQAVNGRASAITKEYFKFIKIPISKISKPLIKIKPAAIKVPRATINYLKARKAGWMRTIDDIVARGKKPNWKSTFWKNPEREKYWKAMTKKTKGSGIKKLKILKAEKEPIFKTFEKAQIYVKEQSNEWLAKNVPKESYAGKEFKKAVRWNDKTNIRFWKKDVQKEVAAEQFEKYGVGFKRAKTAKEFKDILTFEESSAIDSWSTRNWKSIRKNFIQGNIKGEAKSFQDALAKAPLHKGVAYRGGISSGQDVIGHVLAGRMKEGKVLNFWAPASGTKSERIARQFMASKGGLTPRGERYILEFHTKGLADISDIVESGYRYQKEVIIPSRSKWRVTNILEETKTVTTIEDDRIKVTYKILKLQEI